MLRNRQDNAELVETVRVGLGLWRNVWNGDVRNGYDALTELAERLELLEEALAAIEVSEPNWAEGVDENCEILRTIARDALRETAQA